MKIAEFSIWNTATEHYDFAKDFDEAIVICELLYSVNGSEWDSVKKSNDLYLIESYMNERGYEAEVNDYYSKF